MMRIKLEIVAGDSEVTGPVREPRAALFLGVKGRLTTYVVAVKVSWQRRWTSGRLRILCYSARRVGGTTSFRRREPKAWRGIAKVMVVGGSERETGLEPATLCLGSRCSTAELLPRECCL